MVDINDFDETLPGPWEWDLKRLAASLEIAGRDRGFDRKQRRAIATAAAREYRTAMRRLAELTNLDVWYLRVELAMLREQMSAGREQAGAEDLRQDGRQGPAQGPGCGRSRS